MKLALVVAALLAALAIPAGLLFARDESEPDFAGSQPPQALTHPVFDLLDDEGNQVRSADLGDKAFAVTFLDAQCTDACPIIAAQIGQAMRALGADRDDFEALAISVDPVRDTPAKVDAFLTRYRAKGELRYLNGTLAQLRPIWRAFAVSASHDTGQSNMHSAPVRVFDANGRWRSTLHPGVDLTAPSLVHDLRAARDAS